MSASTALTAVILCFVMIRTVKVSYAVIAGTAADIARISRKNIAKGLPILPMSAMAVRDEAGEHWKNGCILQSMPRKNMSRPSAKPAQAFP